MTRAALMTVFPWTSPVMCVACDSPRLKIVNVEMNAPCDRESDTITDWAEYSLDIDVACQQCGHGYTIMFLYNDTDGHGITTDTDVYRCPGEPQCVIPCGPPPAASEAPAARPRLRLIKATAPER